MTPEQRRAALEGAFSRVFGHPDSRSQDQMLVMAWLAKFCRKNESTFIPDSPGRSGHLEGRREVLLEIERRVSPPAPSVDAILGITAIEDSHDD